MFIVILEKPVIVRGEEKNILVEGRDVASWHNPKGILLPEQKELELIPEIPSDNFVLSVTLVDGNGMIHKTLKGYEEYVVMYEQELTKTHRVFEGTVEVKRPRNVAQVCYGIRSMARWKKAIKIECDKVEAELRNLLFKENPEDDTQFLKAIRDEALYRLFERRNEWIKKMNHREVSKIELRLSQEYLTMKDVIPGKDYPVEAIREGIVGSSIIPVPAEIRKRLTNEKPKKKKEDKDKEKK